MIIDCRRVAWLLVFVTLLPVTVAFAHEHLIVGTGRYSAVALKAPLPAQIDPLQATITLEIPGAIQTVGQAIGHLLRDSGYRLAPAQAADPRLRYLFDLTLPPIHRSLGPLSLRAVLTTLAGHAYRLVTDPVHRLVSFERKAVYRLLGDLASPESGFSQRFQAFSSPCAVKDSAVLESDLTVAFAHRCYRLSSDKVCCPATAQTPTDFQPEPAVIQEDRWYGGFKDK